jgi:methyl-accepting chemotaxis protein
LAIRLKRFGAPPQHFCSPIERDSASYREFWSSLGRGEFQSGEFKRFAKGDRTIWIQASYNPIADGAGKPVKVVKFATDVTKAKSGSLDAAGKLAAVSRTQATIEFELDGTIITANENFLTTVDIRFPISRGSIIGCSLI